MESFQNNKFFKIFIAVLIVFFIFLCLKTIYLFYQNQQLKDQINVTNFEECSLVKGARIQESYPAVCERQKDGKCGWTQTDELKACLRLQKAR